MSRWTLFLAATALAAAVTGAACNTGAPAAPTVGPGVGVYTPNPPAVYLPKVKDLLVGEPPTDDEMARVTADPTQLASLVDQWMSLPEYRQKMLRFFELAFQQTQITIPDFSDQVFPRLVDTNKSTAPLLLQNAEESFARTALELESEGRPFTETMTTTRFMLTPALMEMYGFLDAWHVDDAGKVYDRLAATDPKFSITVEASEGPIPMSETLDPTSPRYMHWFDPDVAGHPIAGPGCSGDPLVFPARSIVLHALMYGVLDFRPNGSGGQCGTFNGTAAAPQLQASDFDSWRMVTIRPPAPGEDVTPFYDLPRLRASNELVLSIPRVGFFSTPAFFANWRTNTSNQMRVTTNQALIVALGHAIDVTDTTPSDTTPGLDSAHAEAACVQCHRLLDPTRSIFAATYSWGYHEQSDTNFAGQKGIFQFAGVVTPVQSIADFGATLAAHPALGPAWIQKLCYFANSAPCDEGDPAFAQVLGAWRGSGWSWNALVRELFSSPLVIDAQTVAVARRDHWCAALGNRLGLGDVCGLDARTPRDPSSSIPAIVAGLPSDGYGRGAVAPVLPNEPTLFYRAGTENVCEEIATRVIDAPNARWSSAAPDAAIDDFVHVVMALTKSDPRATRARGILRAHFDDALAQPGITPTAALQSTFVAACLAPSSTAIGL